MTRKPSQNAARAPPAATPHTDSPWVPAAQPGAQSPQEADTAQSPTGRAAHAAVCWGSQQQSSPLCVSFCSASSFIQSCLRRRMERKRTRQGSSYSSCFVLQSPLSPQLQHRVCFMQRLLSFRHETKLSLSAERHRAGSPSSR